MRCFTLLVLIPFLMLCGCRDREETALDRLQKRGYGFAVSDFHRAARDGDLEVIGEFLAAGMAADVETADGNTAFREAIEHRRDAVAMALLEAGVEPDQRLANGRTALIEVATRTGEDLHFLETLLREGADPRAVDANGMTAMMAASLGGHVDAVRRLLDRDVRSLDKALMLAAASGHTHCMDVLITRGAYVNCRSHDTRTPLMLAAAKGHQEAVALLLQHQADRFATDADGKTAADWADDGAHRALAVILRDTSTLRWAPGRTAQISEPLRDDPLPSIDGQILTLTAEEAPQATVDQTSSAEPLRPILDVPEDNDTKLVPTTSTVRKAVDLQHHLNLGRYQERFLPILLTAVEGDKANVRILTQRLDQQETTIGPGEIIPTTNLRVTKVTKRLRAAKGGGEIDVSEMLADNIDTGASERFVVDSLSHNPDSHLVVQAGKQQRQAFAARLKDSFTIAETGQQFQVVAIRPHQLLIRDLNDNTVLTIERQ